MNKISYLLACLCFSQISFADDTEIYGATAIDEANRVNSNVLFIMDTSGSMSGKVDITLNPYNPTTIYSGDYKVGDIYNSKYDGKNNGHNATALTQSDSTNCSDEVTTLNTVGKVLGNFKQWRWNWWRSLSDGNDGTIRCDQGNSKWLYTGNYMNWYHDAANNTTSTRMEVVVDVVKELTNSLTNINLGLMRFDQNSDGGMIDVPVSDIATSGALIRSRLNTYYPQGGTPLEESMYEAARYYRGENWMFGDNSQPNTSVSTSRSGSKYKSPIDASCQKNHIILLTDGEPTGDTTANDDVRALVNNLTLPSGLSKSCSGNGVCLDELSYWMKNTDHATGQIGSQEITTYTIGGFDLAGGVELLKRTANWGGGRYFEANDTAGLTDALDSIFLDILSTDTTFTAPAVSVNAFNASEHRDDLFYALFRPADNVKWTGNLKKYRLTSEGIVVGQDDTVPAISTSTGYFNESIFDYWNDTQTPDGKKVQEGGVANLLTPATRHIYTEDSANYLGSFSAFATQATFGMEADTAANFVKVRQWALGYDVDDENGDGSNTDSRNAIGDPLHSEPVIVTYGGTDEKPDSTIYFGTNEGFIHAIDTETGLEEFAFIPKALHGSQKIYYDNNAAAADKPYGMDGQISTWFYDKNNNNVILDSAGSVESGEHAYIYAGMRRGGNNYYALDVTNRNAPSMKFKIEGGKGDFLKLGQSWSRMVVTKVKFPGGEADGSRFVIFFSGGYDTNQDSNTLNQADGTGNAIYMVDAKTGERLWWASNENANLDIPEMVNSMPASISAVDITGDGNVNYLFAADSGGRVFRIDLNLHNSGASDFAKGGVIASLAGTEASSNRRFYNKPNVALVKDKLYGDYLTIAIGSGHRAHPIQTTDVENRFYVIKDYYPYNAPASYKVRTEAATDKLTLASDENADPLKLYNASALMNDGKLALTSDMQVLMSNGGGWYITFATKGEKVLAESTTFSGAIIFTTFSPSGGTTTACGPDTGASRIYALDQKWAMAAVDLDDDGDTDADDASKVLAHSGIAPRPVVIYRKGGGKTIAIGTETIDDNRFSPGVATTDPCLANGTCGDISACQTDNCDVKPTYWRQNEDL